MNILGNTEYFWDKVPKTYLILQKKKKIGQSSKYVDQSPAFLISDYFVRSNEIVRTKWPIYGHFVQMIL